MRIGELRSIGHNIADSLASGLGLPVGHFGSDIFGEATASAEGYILVDFLAGTCSGSPTTFVLRQAVQHYSEFLSELCEKHGIERSVFTKLQARFGVDLVWGPHFTVTIVDDRGRRSVDRYVGYAGKKFRKRRAQ